MIQSFSPKSLSVALALMLAAALMGCAPQAPQNPRVGMHLNTATGRVSPSVAANLGGVWLGGTRGGGAVGTRIGGLGVSAGF